MPAWRRAQLAAALGICLSAVVTLIMLRPALGAGYLLYRDFITVPDPALGPRAWGMSGGAPRAVPLDAVMALCDPVVPTWLQQKAILFGSLWLGGSGVAILLRHRGVLAAALGGVVGTWSPYAAERLLLGQAPTLLAWSMLPWLVMASRRTGSVRARVALIVLAALPATLTPSGGLTAGAAAVLLSVVASRGRREILTVLAFGVTWCLPWILPALGGRTGAGVAEGAAAFRVEATGVTGVLDVVTGGGVWAEGARLASRDGLLAGAAMVILLVLAALGLTQFDGALRRLLALGLLVPPAVVLLLASPVALPVWAAAQSLPGVGLFRDTHRVLALSSFALAALVPVGLSSVVSTLQRRVAGGRVVVLRAVRLGAASVAAAVVALGSPDAPARLHQAYAPVFFPSDWARVVALVGDDRSLVLPWQPMRVAAWNGERPFLDPLPLALVGGVVAASDLVVERDGERYHVGSGDPGAAMGWRDGRVDGADLGQLGIAKVVEWRGVPGRPASTTDLEVVWESPTFRIWKVR